MGKCAAAAAATVNEVLRRYPGLNLNPFFLFFCVENFMGFVSWWDTSSWKINRKGDPPDFGLNGILTTLNR